jgi:hypothetical protein
MKWHVVSFGFRKQKKTGIALGGTSKLKPSKTGFIKTDVAACHVEVTMVPPLRTTLLKSEHHLRLIIIYTRFISDYNHPNF